jgi:hypothetical protein
MRRLGADVEEVNALAGAVTVEARRGRMATARAMLQRAESLSVRYEPIALHTAVYMAEAYMAVGEPRAALRWLERYTTTRDVHYQLHLSCDPPLVPLRRNQRFAALLVQPVASQRCGS